MIYFISYLYVEHLFSCPLVPSYYGIGYRYIVFMTRVHLTECKLYNFPKKNSCFYHSSNVELKQTLWFLSILCKLNIILLWLIQKQLIYFKYLASCDSEVPLRYHGDVWNISACEFCLCENDEVQCHKATCEPLFCELVR